VNARYPNVVQTIFKMHFTWRNIMTLRIALPIAGLALIAGCASTGPAPSDTAENSSAAIRAAEEVGATHSPDAALHLQLAKEQFEHAGMLPQRDKEWAERLLLRAQADAELALALARSESEKNAALGAIDKVKKLKESAVQ
jgi:hypothetical protein